MQITTRNVVMVALFAALTVIGTMIKIPLPTGAFVHLGNAVLLLAVLLLGYVKGSLAGGLGFAIFDVLNGFAVEAPYFIVESFIVGAAAYGLFLAFKKNPKHVWQIILIASGTGVAKLVMTQIKNLVRQLYLGMDFPTAFTTAALSLPATVINVILTVILVSFLYFPLKKAISPII
ncbi:ECF transporter S component [Tetragenococcus solitarius]|uniref:ECF transporter S component n=1 Tax=Tetragenococcus solitarius TaxID=71453 RepID=A0ABN3YCV6_9ENTE|nr:ECF transporter S component [Tetragenococcus solitarius]